MTGAQEASRYLGVALVVPPQVLWPGEGGATVGHLAHVGPVPRVDPDVHVHLPLVLERDATLPALVVELAVPRALDTLDQLLVLQRLGSVPPPSR